MFLLDNVEVAKPNRQVRDYAALFKSRVVRKGFKQDAVQNLRAFDSPTWGWMDLVDRHGIPNALEFRLDYGFVWDDFEAWDEIYSAYVNDTAELRRLLRTVSVLNEEAEFGRPATSVRTKKYSPEILLTSRTP